MPTRLSATLLVALTTATPACGDDGHDDHDHAPDADPSQPDAPGPDAAPNAVETATLTLNPGQFEEGVVTAGPGDRIHILLSAPTPDIAWNIHGHAGGGTQTVIEEDDKMTVDYWFEPTEQSDWYVMPGNSGSDTLTIDVTLEIYGDATFGGWL